MTPPDREARERIRTDLDTTLLVEAAAGTGKTTCLVARMVALVASGRCRIHTLAAVTFTRKAAAELRGRFTAALEGAARGAAGSARERLEAAVARSGSCFIGTTHAFCGRLLRERPVEGQVRIGFEELDEEAEAEVRREGWEGFAAALHAAEPPDGRLLRLAAVGLDVRQLREAFDTFAGHPDVEAWPAPEVELGDLDGARAELARYLAHVSALRPLPQERGNDRLMDRLEHAWRLARVRSLEREDHLLEVLEVFDARPKVVQRQWPEGPAQGKAEAARWEDFAERVARPLLARWRAKRYAAAVPILAGAAADCARLRAERGVLSFQDLLLGAARMLRGRPEVRRFFRARFTHLLVDEFQDTDPLQAEVALLLTADDPGEADWRRCRPVPGSLFLVGDPKQSIYRFRRADIATYQAVRSLVQDAGGAVVGLETSFRSSPRLVAWTNAAFAPPVFPAEATEQAPAAHPLAPARPEAPETGLAGLFTLTVPAGDSGGNEAAAAHDARRVARFIRHALDAGLPVATGPGARPARPGDFLVVTWARARLARYAAALREMGVPHETSGGSARGQVEELGLLASFLRACVEPENPVALVAVLRGGVFGLSDAELYAFRAAGGRFSYRSKVPPGLEAATGARFGDAFARLARGAERLRVMTPVAALERTAADLGLDVAALAGPGGDVRAGSLAKAFAALRARLGPGRPATELADLLERLVAADGEFDVLPARARREPAVRVMNLHRAKGLEAEVVFLADPGGRSRHAPTLHVDRTGGKVTGHLAVVERKGRFRRLLACPERWEQLAGREEGFAEAERRRLLYVAATRAGTMLAVSRRSLRDGDNPWDQLAARLGEAPELPDPGATGRPPRVRVDLPPDAAPAAEASISRRWERIAVPTGAALGVREATLGETLLFRRAPSTEHGTEWGAVVHLLLETAGREPGRDLGELARAALEEQGLGAERSAEAVATVEAVRRSALWGRSAAAGSRLVEVPLFVTLPPGDPMRALLSAGDPAAGVPLLLRGVVDLAFREHDGWVVVDWKSEPAADGEDLGRLVARYSAQVRLYAAAWGRVTGEPVSEAGLFFTGASRYVRVVPA